MKQFLNKLNERIDKIVGCLQKAETSIAKQIQVKGPNEGGANENENISEEFMRGINA